MRILALVAAAALAVAAATMPAQAAGVGVVMLHGNLSSGGQFYRVAQALELSGIAVEAPDMCWAETRVYDKTPEECMEEVDAAFQRLRDRGIDRFVVSGHSMGGINALLYASRHSDLTAVVVFAPGSGNRGEEPSAALRMAAALEAGGRGDQIVEQGGGLRVKAHMLLAYNGADSVLNDDAILPNITAPLLWIAGRNDRGQRDAEARFARLPANPLNQFSWIQSDHYAAPHMGVGVMIEWLQQFKPDYSALIGAQ
jgi:pimeloyl-ACP methyl ester carboxylesterase